MIAVARRTSRSFVLAPLRALHLDLRCRRQQGGLYEEVARMCAAAGAPSEFVGIFKNYYGPTMNAFEAAEKNGKAADLQSELEALFNRENKSAAGGATSIPANFLKVTVSRR